MASGSALFCQRSGEANDERPSPRPLLRNLIFTAPFLLLYWCNIIHHEVWRDELNAWAIVRASANLSTLARFVHYEGHPWLWYFVLWLPSRLSTSPVAMKSVEAAISTAAYLVIGLKSPFTRFEKLLIFLGYYISFEYTVLSRMYSIMLLMAVLYAWRRVERPKGVIGIAVILGVMASTDMSGVLLSFALLMEYAHACWIERSGKSAEGANPAWQVVAALVYLALLAISIHSLIPAKDIDWRPAGGGLFSEATRMRHIVRSVANVAAGSWWPISHHFPHKFWDTDSSKFRWLTYLAPLMLLGCWSTFRRDRAGLLLTGAALFLATAFADTVYVGRPRHWGIVVLAFIVGLWLMRSRMEQESGDSIPSRLPVAAYAMLGLSACAGLIAITSTWVRPFSQSAQVARWLQQNHLDSGELVGNRDISFAPIAENLQRPVYFLECGCKDQLKLFSRGRGMLLDEELPGRLAEAHRRLQADEMILISDRTLNKADLEEMRRQSLKASPLVEFTGAEAELESYYLYRITSDVRP